MLKDSEVIKQHHLVFSSCQSKTNYIIDKELYKEKSTREANYLDGKTFEKKIARKERRKGKKERFKGKI